MTLSHKQLAAATAECIAARVKKARQWDCGPEIERELGVFHQLGAVDMRRKLREILLELLADSPTDVDGDEGRITHFKFTVDHSHIRELCQLAGYRDISDAMDALDQEAAKAAQAHDTR